MFYELLNPIQIVVHCTVPVAVIVVVVLTVVDV